MSAWRQAQTPAQAVVSDALQDGLAIPAGLLLAADYDAEEIAVLRQGGLLRGPPWLPSDAGAVTLEPELDLPGTLQADGLVLLPGGGRLLVLDATICAWTPG